MRKLYSLILSLIFISFFSFASGFVTKEKHRFEQQAVLTVVTPVEPMINVYGQSPLYATFTYMVSGAQEAKVYLKAPEGFEVAGTLYGAPGAGFSIDCVDGYVRGTGYIRLKKTNPVGIYSGNIYVYDGASASGALVGTIPVGNSPVTAGPFVINNSLKPFRASVSQPSASQIMYVTAVSLDTVITITAPADFEVGIATPGAPVIYASSTTFKGSSVSPATYVASVSVRLKAGATGEKSGPITVSAGSLSQTTTVTGTVTTQMVTTPTLQLYGQFTYPIKAVVGYPSSATLVTAFVASNFNKNTVFIKAPDGFEIAATSSNTWSPSLLYTGVTTALFNIKLRLKAGLAAGIYGGDINVYNGASAADELVGVIGVPPSTVSTDNFVLTTPSQLSFATTATVPSVYKVFYITTGDINRQISVAASDGFELAIVKTGGGPVPTVYTSSLTYNGYNADVAGNHAIIAVRLKPGIPGNKTGDVTISANGFTKTLQVSGKVEPTPLAPTKPASNIVVSNIAGTSATISWTNGDGAGRVVLLKAGTGGNYQPVNYTQYNIGSRLRDNTWFVVYTGTGSSVNVTDLTPATQYTAVVKEYNGPYGSEQYIETDGVNNPKTFTTREPIVYVLSTSGTLNKFTGGAGSNIPAQTFSVFASSGANVKIEAPRGFIIAETSGFDYQSNQVAYTGTGNFKTIWVRPTWDAEGNLSGNITVSAYGALTVNVPVSASLAPHPTIDLVGAVDSTLTINADFLSGSFKIPYSAVTNNPDKFNLSDGFGHTVYLKGNLSGSPIDVPFFNWMTAGSKYLFLFNVTNSATGANSYPRFIIVNVLEPTGVKLLQYGQSFYTTAGLPSAPEVYKMVPEKPVAQLTIVAPAGFEVAAQATKPMFSDSLIVALPDTANYLVRLKAGAQGSVNGNLLFKANGHVKSLALIGTINPGIPKEVLNVTMEVPGYMYYGDSAIKANVSFSARGLMTQHVVSISVPAGVFELNNPLKGTGYSSVLYDTVDTDGTLSRKTYGLRLLKNLKPGTYKGSIVLTDLVDGRFDSIAIAPFVVKELISINQAPMPLTGASDVVSAKTAFSLAVSKDVNYTWAKIIAPAGFEISDPYNNGFYDSVNIATSSSASGTFGIRMKAGPAGTISGDVIIDYTATNSRTGATLRPSTTLKMPVTGTITALPTPTVLASNIKFNNITSSSATISWTNGNGNGRTVFISKYNDYLPSIYDGQWFYASTTFGNGSAVSSGPWYCVYIGSGNSVQVVGLQPGDYYVLVVENNTMPNTYVRYAQAVLKSVRLTVTPPVPPTQVSYRLTASNLTTSEATFSWVNGNGAHRALFIAKDNPPMPPVSNGTDYYWSTVYPTGQQVGNSGWYRMYGGTDNSVTVSYLSPGTYRAVVVDYNGEGTETKYLTTGLAPINFTIAAPGVSAPTQVSYHLNFTNSTSNSTTLTWTNGNGGNRAVFLASGNPAMPSPVTGTAYTANTKFGLGSQVGTSGWYCIYNGTSNSVNITGLSPGTYRAVVIDYNGTQNNQNYLTTGLAPYSVTLNAPGVVAPTQVSYHLNFTNITSTSATLSWTNGNGGNRAVFLAAGTPAMPAPVTGTAYTANGRFGFGTQVGTSGWYCIYNGTGNTVNISGLSQGTYRAVVIDYNGTIGNQKYLTTGLAPLGLTVGAPVIQAPTQVSYHLSFTNVTSSTATLTWTNGNGAGRAVWIARGTPAMPAPVDGTTYAANTIWGNGDMLSNTWYCVYNGAGNTVNISGLTAGTYRAVVTDYNGTTGGQKYLKTGLAPIGLTINASPGVTVQAAANLAFSNVTTNSATLSWTRGGGAACAVFVTNTYPPTPPLSNDVAYAGNATYGQGGKVSFTAWYCVYNGTGTTVNINGLTNGSYRAMVVEYNGIGGGQQYFLDNANYLDLSIAPSGPLRPTQVSYHVNYSTWQSSTTTLSWTNGNGAKRAVFIAKGTPAMPATPDGKTYIPNPAFGRGESVNNSYQWYCVYNGSGNSVTITNLPNGTYRAVVVDYNGGEGSEMYLTTGLAPISITISAPALVAPTQVSYGLTFKNTTSGTTDISWTNGNGVERQVFMCKGSLPMPPLVDDTFYTWSYSFGSDPVAGGGWYCVYRGTGNSTTVNALTDNTTYRVVVVDYNWVDGSVKYLTTGLAPAYVTTLPSSSPLGITNKLTMSTDNQNAGTPDVEPVNILSPNGDGKNDTFIIKNIEAYPNSIVTIITKDGRQIYTTKGYHNDWDGGGSLAKGTYYYTIDLGNGKNLKGYITVL